jgi:transposase-like protein
MKSMPRRIVTEEFKKEAVRLYKEQGLALAETSRHLGIASKSLKSWVALDEEVRRRERVIRIFSNPDAAIRLLGAILAETHETWQETKTFDLQDFYTWLQDKHLNPDDDHTIRLRP